MLRRRSKEYFRLTENSLSVIAKDGVHLCLWLAANRRFKCILRSLSLERSHPLAVLEPFRWGEYRETVGFLYRWEEMRRARHWGPKLNFPELSEIAAFVYLTLIPEYWAIYLEREGQPPGEALPLVEHESLHSDLSGYDV